jgi:ABC-type Zn uptake system ZnuABC Zn-binding protein ZnuA
MKKTVLLLIFSLLICMFSGCQVQAERADIAATTLPVYQFTQMLCQGTDLTVTRLVTESVSCLHDYSLNVSQVKALEAAKLVVISGAGLEDFMADNLRGKHIIDASEGIALLERCHDHDHEGHSHETDPHIWLSVANATAMAKNIYFGLRDAYPELAATFQANMDKLMQKLRQLEAYAKAQLADLDSRQIITFHDGFSYLADAYGLTILASVEEEAGSEVSSKGLIELIELVRQHKVIALFMEENGSDAAAKVISTETGVNLYILNMAMAGEDYFEAMYHNIDTLREALQ